MIYLQTVSNLFIGLLKDTDSTCKLREKEIVTPGIRDRGLEFKQEARKTLTKCIFTIAHEMNMWIPHYSNINSYTYSTMVV